MAGTRWRIGMAGLFLAGALAACDDPGSLTGINPEPEADSVDAELTQAIRAAAHPLTGAAADYDPLLALAEGARFVLLGESTHGTHQFYRERARITLRLVEERAFTAIAVEGDWLAAERVHRYVRGEGGDASAQQALSGFTRFPRWMWRNADFAQLVEAVRRHNAAAPDARDVGVYGLDLQSYAFESMDAVVDYLERVDSEAARRARLRYGCFSRYGGDPAAYARAAVQDAEASCEDEAAAQLQELQARYAGASPAAAAFDSLFSAFQHARVVAGAEAFYRVSAAGGNAWNVRDRHMAATVEAIAAHEARKGRTARVAVWAHNTHVGDDRATEMGQAGEVNLGQLLRERRPGETVLVGFTTFSGTVTAAPGWGDTPRTFTLRPALEGSHAELFEDTGLDAFLLVLRGRPDLADPLSAWRLQRAVGVVYLPQSERASHYFRARLAEQFDAVVYLETTRSVDPL